MDIPHFSWSLNRNEEEEGYRIASDVSVGIRFLSGFLIPLLIPFSMLINKLFGCEGRFDGAVASTISKN
jgi:hypothetical protein